MPVPGPDRNVVPAQVVFLELVFQAQREAPLAGRHAPRAGPPVRNQRSQGIGLPWDSSMAADEYSAWRKPSRGRNPGPPRDGISLRFRLRSGAGFPEKVQQYQMLVKTRAGGFFTIRRGQGESQPLRDARGPAGSP